MRVAGRERARPQRRASHSRCPSISLTEGRARRRRSRSSPNAQHEPDDRRLTGRELEDPGGAGAGPLRLQPDPAARRMRTPHGHVDAGVRDVDDRRRTMDAAPADRPRPVAGARHLRAVDQQGQSSAPTSTSDRCEPALASGTVGGRPLAADAQPTGARRRSRAAASPGWLPWVSRTPSCPASSSRNDTSSATRGAARTRPGPLRCRRAAKPTARSTCRCGVAALRRRRARMTAHRPHSPDRPTYRRPVRVRPVSALDVVGQLVLQEHRLAGPRRAGCPAAAGGPAAGGAAPRRAGRALRGPRASPRIRSIA